MSRETTSMQPGSPVIGTMTSKEEITVVQAGPDRTGDLRVNTAAGLVGKAWTMALAVAVMPFYIKYLGIESYGLIGLSASFQALLSLLDFGLAAALTREMARLSGETDANDGRTVLRTLEILYCLIFLVAGTIVIVLAPYIAAHWVNPVKLSVQSVTDSLRLVGISAAAQSVMGFYQAGLMGLQRQVSLNVVLVLTATARGVGGLLIAALITNRIEAFFLWQIIPLAVGVVVTRYCLWRALPATHHRRFDRRIIGRCWRFAFGWASNSIVLAVFSQMDKLLLSRFLTLDNVGYYSLAQTVASPVSAVTGAVGASIFPHFTQLVARHRAVQLRAVYHKACQYLVLAVVPLAVVVSVFPMDILSVLTGNPTVARSAGTALRIIVLGAMFSSLVTIPNYIQLAHAQFRLVLRTLLALLAVYVPLLIFTVTRYGTDGAAFSWLVINFCFLFSVPLMHRNFMHGEFREWLLKDTVAPLVSAGLCGVAIGAVYPLLAGHQAGVIPIALAYCLVVVATACALGRVRSKIRLLVPAFAGLQRSA